MIVIRERPKPKPKPKREPQPASRKAATTVSPQPAPPVAPRRVRPPSSPPVRPQPQPQPAAEPIRVSDNFDDGVRNNAVWYGNTTGSGVTIAEQNGRLEISFAADALQGGEFNLMAGQYGMHCRVLGNFDARVDYELLGWPTSNGVAVHLVGWYRTFSTTSGRYSGREGSDAYVAWFPRYGNSFDSSDRRGTLRLTRTGSHTLARYKSGGRWLSLAAAEHSGAPRIGLQAQSTDAEFGDQPVRIAFDNFVVTYDQPLC